jgi:hypothetical protein
MENSGIQVTTFLLLVLIRQEQDQESCSLYRVAIVLEEESSLAVRLPAQLAVLAIL